MLNDKQIGTIKDGKKVWPDLDFFGQRYSRAGVSTMGLGTGRFVVLPVNFERRPGAQEQLAALRDEARAEPQKPAPRSAKKVSDGQS